MTNTPIVFLDFDGVLNSNAWIWSHSSEGFDHIAPSLVAHVNTLLRNTGAKVVVSSAWRVLFNQAELQAGLEEHGFTGEIIGTTDQIGSVRGYQIERWRLEHEHTGPFVILDDSEDMAHLMPWLVRTNPEYGISEHDRKQAEYLLEYQPGARNRVLCTKCFDVVESRHVHDFRWCKCKAIFTDGGRQYIRRGGDFEAMQNIGERIVWRFADGTVGLP